MAHVWADRVAETTTTTGTGALTLAGAMTGFQRFSAVCSVNDTVVYAIEAVDSSGVPTGDWELGIGTYSATNTLTRTSVIKSSNANAVVTLAAGTKNVFLDDIASTRNTLQQYSGTSEPGAPAEGLAMFAKDFNGWPAPYMRGATGRSLTVNPLMGGRAGVGTIVPVPASLSPTILGGTIASTNTSSITPTATSQFTAIARGGVNTTATASTAASLRSTSSPILFLSSPANSGFRFLISGGMETVGNTNCRWFMGLYTSSTAPAATFDPGTALHLIGIGCSATDTNAQLITNDGTGSGTKTDLGASYPGKTAQGGFMELRLWASGSTATTVFYHVRRLDDLTIAPITGSITTDLPLSGLMYPHWTINNNATAAQSILAAGKCYWETGI